MRTNQIGDWNFVSAFSKTVTKDKLFKTKLFDQMNPHLNLMAQLI